MSAALETINSDVGARTPAAVYDRTSEKNPEEQKPFVERLKGLRERLNSEDTARDRELYARAVTVEMMYRGQQYGFVNRYNNKWEQYPQAIGRKQKAYNLFRGHSDAITVQHTLARVDLQIVPLPVDDADDDTVAKAKFANELVDYYEETLLDETSKQIEGKRKQFGGGVFRRLRWNAKDDRQTYRKPVFENQPVKLAPDAYTCADCGADGDASELGGQDGSDLGSADAERSSETARANSRGGVSSTNSLQPSSQETKTNQSEGLPSGQPENNQNPEVSAGTSCPQCGSQNVMKIEVPEEQIPVVTGYEDVPCGDFICESFPIYAVKFDRAGGTFNKATWMSLKFRARPEEIKAKIPWWRKRSSGDTGLNEGLRAEAVLSRSVGSTPRSTQSSGNTRSSDTEKVTCELMWLEPLWYSDWKMPVDLKLQDGSVIPKGTPIPPLYPKGMYILWVDDEPLDFANEDFHSQWKFTPHILIPSTPEGDGIEDLVPFQQDINVTKNLTISNIRYVDGAGMIYRPNYLENHQISGLPYERHPVKNSWPEDQPLTNVVAMLPREPLPHEVPQYGEESRRDMQWASKANSTSIGAPDINSMGGQKTMGGMQLMTQQASSQRAPELAVQAQTDCEWAELLLTQFAENAVYERYIPLQGKVGLPPGVRLSGKDVKAKFRVTAKRRSYLPKTESDRQNELMAALQAVGAAGGPEVLVQAPGLKREIEERYNVDLGLDTSKLDHHECRKRLDKMKQMLPQAQQAATQYGPEAVPMILSQMVPIMPDADDHGICIKWWQDWLKEDEADRVDPAVKQAAHAKIADHKQAIVENEQEKTQMGVDAQAPAMKAQQDAEAASRQGQADAEQSGAGQQQAHDAQQQAAAASGQAEQAIGQHMLEEHSKSQDHKRQLEMEAVKQKGQEKLAKMKSGGANE